MFKNSHNLNTSCGVDFLKPVMKDIFELCSTIDIRKSWNKSNKSSLCLLISFDRNLMMDLGNLNFLKVDM